MSEERNSPTTQLDQRWVENPKYNGVRLTSLVRDPHLDTFSGWTTTECGMWETHQTHREEKSIEGKEWEMTIWWHKAKPERLQCQTPSQLHTLERTRDWENLVTWLDSKKQPNCALKLSCLSQRENSTLKWTAARRRFWTLRKVQHRSPNVASREKLLRGSNSMDSKMSVQHGLNDYDFSPSHCPCPSTLAGTLCTPEIIKNIERLATVTVEIPPHAYFTQFWKNHRSPSETLLNDAQERDLLRTRTSPDAGSAVHSFPKRSRTCKRRNATNGLGPLVSACLFCGNGQRVLSLKEALRQMLCKIVAPWPRRICGFILPKLSKTSQDTNPRKPNTRRRTKNRWQLPGDTSQQVNLPTARPLELKAGNCAITCECPLSLAEVRATVSGSSSSTTRSKESFGTVPLRHASLQRGPRESERWSRRRNLPLKFAPHTPHTPSSSQKKNALGSWICVPCADGTGALSPTCLTTRAKAFSASDGARRDRVGMPLRINTRWVPEKLAHNCIPMCICRPASCATQLIHHIMPCSLASQWLQLLALPLFQTSALSIEASIWASPWPQCSQCWSIDWWGLSPQLVSIQLMHPVMRLETRMCTLFSRFRSQGRGTEVRKLKPVFRRHQCPATSHQRLTASLSQSSHSCPEVPTWPRSFFWPCSLTAEISRRSRRSWLPEHASCWQALQPDWATMQPPSSTKCTSSISSVPWSSPLCPYADRSLAPPAAGTPHYSSPEVPTKSGRFHLHAVCLWSLPSPAGRWS